jgi:hypothetical protein
MTEGFIFMERGQLRCEMASEMLPEHALHELQSSAEAVGEQFGAEMAEIYRVCARRNGVLLRPLWKTPVRLVGWVGKMHLSNSYLRGMLVG